MLLRTKCTLLYYAEVSDVIASSLKEQLPQLTTELVSSLEEMLNVPQDVKHYEYNKTFDEVKDEPCLILHSSGSTGQFASSFFRSLGLFLTSDR
jgi:hypothetical protein